VGADQARDCRISLRERPLCPAETASTKGHVPFYFRNAIMRFRVLACDYDGTLAHDGVLKEPTAAALDRFRSGGGRLLMVTGRELPDLQSVCGVLDKFDVIVAENGALLYRPQDGISELLCAQASAELARVHRRRQDRGEQLDDRSGEAAIGAAVVRGAGRQDLRPVLQLVSGCDWQSGS